LDENPPTREHGTDKPGRAFSSVGHGRSGMEATDRHDIEEHRFADRVAAAREKLVRELGVKALIAAAPPRTLAESRKALHPEVKRRISLCEHVTQPKQSPSCQMESPLRSRAALFCSAFQDPRACATLLVPRLGVAQGSHHDDDP
jgi:hypothetical protein